MPKQTEPSSSPSKRAMSPVLLSEAEAADAARLLKLLLSTYEESSAEREIVGEANAGRYAQSRLRAIAGRIHAARSARNTYIPGDLIGEPAWDILIGLYARQSRSEPLNVGQVCALSQVPATTGLRYIGVLHDQGLISRKASMSDQRLIHVKLTDRATSILDRYFAHLIEAGLEDE